jgi:hypothetical protein
MPFPPRSRCSLVLLLASALSTMLFSIVAAAAPPSQEETADRQAILGRFDSLKAITLDYVAESTHTPPVGVGSWDAQLPSGTGTITVKRGVERAECQFAFLKGMSRWENHPTAETLAQTQREVEGRRSTDPVTGVVQTYRPGIAELLIERPSGFAGRIAADAPLPSDVWIDQALGLRDVRDQEGGWLTPDGINGMTWARDKDKRVVLSRRTPQGYPQEYVFDPAQGYALVAYRLLDKESPTLITEVTASDFRLVDGVTVPFTMTARIINLGLKKQVFGWHGTVTHCEVNGTTNTEAHYAIAWPKGIVVVDARQAPPVRIKTEVEGEKTPD